MQEMIVELKSVQFDCSDIKKLPCTAGREESKFKSKFEKSKLHSNCTYKAKI